MTQTAKKSPFSMNVDLMHGPIFKNLLLFMLPIFISSLFQQLYNTVDTMIVGNVLGDTALAAIGSCGSIYELLVGFGLGIGNGLAIVAARSYGAQDHDLLKKTVAGSLVIGLVASLCITLAGVLGLHPLLLMLDTPAEILDDAYRYILTIDLGVLVMFAYNLCAGLLRAIGNSVMPLVFLLISSGLNVVLDPAAHQVLAHGQPVELSNREYDLLHALMLNAGRVLSREQLEQRLYEWGSEINSNAVEVHIYHLRRKLGAGLIETVRGVGYRIPREQA
jgi:biotin operon repressor